MVLALIKNGKVENTIVVDSEAFGANFPTYTIKRIDLLSPRPGIGWDYDSVTDSFQDNRPKPSVD